MDMSVIFQIHYVYKQTTERIRTDELQHSGSNASIGSRSHSTSSGSQSQIDTHDDCKRSISGIKSLSYDTSSVSQSQKETHYNTKVSFSGIESISHGDSSEDDIMENKIIKKNSNDSSRNSLCLIRTNKQKMK